MRRSVARSRKIAAKFSASRDGNAPPHRWWEPAGKRIVMVHLLQRGRLGELDELVALNERFVDLYECVSCGMLEATWLEADEVRGYVWLYAIGMEPEGLAIALRCPSCIPLARSEDAA